METQTEHTGGNGPPISPGEWELDADMAEGMTEFNLNLLSRIGSLEDGQRRLLDYLSDAKSQMATLVARHEALLLGTIDQPGLMVRLDRLEVSQDRRDKLFVWMATTLFACVVTLAVKVFL